MEGKMDIQQVVSMLSNLGIGGEESSINSLMMLMDMMKNNKFLKRRRRLERESQNDQIIMEDRKVIDVDIKEDEGMRERHSRRSRPRMRKKTLRNRKMIKRCGKKQYDE